MDGLGETHIPHFMPGGLGSVTKFTEDEEIKQNHRVAKYINDMDAELVERFKALKAIQDIMNEFDKEE